MYITFQQKGDCFSNRTISSFPFGLPTAYFFSKTFFEIKGEIFLVKYLKLRPFHMKMERPPDVDLNLHLVSRNTNIAVL